MKFDMERKCTKPNCDCMQRHADKHGLDMECLKSYECFGGHRLIEHTAEKESATGFTGKVVGDMVWDKEKNDFKIVKSESPEIDKEEEPASYNGDLVRLVWLIESLRRREGGCIMNELIAEIKHNFKGIEHIHRKP